MSEFPFHSLGHALSYLNESNPARAKSVNLLEPDRVSRPIYPDFSGRSPRDLWAGVVYSVRAALKGKHEEKIKAWSLRNLGARQRQLAAEEVSEKLGYSLSWVYSALREINDELERELVERGYIKERERYNYDRTAQKTTS